jgi:RNA polymerase sigma-70 factor (ECF subfamily)
VTRAEDSRGARSGRAEAPASDPYAGLRPLMFSIAYRMLASVGEAEDVVQDAFLRYQRALAEGAEIESPRAYLSTVVTRLAIDQLRSARVRRETYVGEWLPEPLLAGDADPAAHAEEADSLSMAFLLLLERLSPVERAVFLLHDIFGYGYDQVAAIVDKSEGNCRQLALRARNHIESEKPRFDASRKERDELAARFFAAVTDGELDSLVEMLAADVVVYGDGGGKAPQWAAPIVGAERVARLFGGLGGQLRELGITIQPRRVNGQPGAVFFDLEGRLTNVWSLDIVDGAVQTVRSVINPDKLRHLGPVADVRALLRERRTNEEPA